MKSELRSLVAGALYPTKAYNLPAVCERYGLEPGDESEAFSSKTGYVKRRLEKLPDLTVIEIAKRVAADFPDDALRAAVEQIVQGKLLSEITRRDVAEALDAIELGGKRDLLELLRHHWPSVDQKMSYRRPLDEALADDIVQHVIRNNDWTNSYVLEQLGFLTCSQAKLFEFVEDVLHPVRRESAEQDQVVAKLNPILKRDGYCLVPGQRVSGYPVYRVRETTPTGGQPVDELISQVLVSFDDGGVHHAWQKALERRTSDPEGAITAAKTLLETVCKYIIDETAGAYGDSDDLPDPLRHCREPSEACAKPSTTRRSSRAFSAIVSILVGNLAALRNKLSDSHGQGKRHVKPQARHAELAVNLAGSMATFLDQRGTLESPSRLSRLRLRETAVSFAALDHDWMKPSSIAAITAFLKFMRPLRTPSFEGDRLSGCGRPTGIRVKVSLRDLSRSIALKRHFLAVLLTVKSLRGP